MTELGRGRGRGARELRTRAQTGSSYPGRQRLARLEDPTRRARGDGAAPRADRDGAREVSKRTGGERAWPPMRCAASSAGPRRRAVGQGGQGAERLLGTGSPGLYTGPWPHPQSLPRGGGAGAPGGEGEAAVRGRGRCPESPPPPPLQHLKVLFCRRRKRSSLEAVPGAESASEPEPGRGEKGEETPRGCSLDPSSDLGGFLPFPAKAAAAPPPALQERDLLAETPGSAIQSPGPESFPPPPSASSPNHWRPSRVKRGKGSKHPTRDPEGPHGPKKLVSSLPTCPSNSPPRPRAPYLPRAHLGPPDLLYLPEN